MSEIKAGNEVLCIETWTTYAIESGMTFTVEDVRRVGNQASLLVDGQWIPERYFEKKEFPKPWTEVESETRVVLQRRTKGRDGWHSCFPRFTGEDAMAEAKAWLERITESGQIKGLPQEYRIVEMETSKRYRVIDEGETPP